MNSRLIVGVSAGLGILLLCSFGGGALLSQSTPRVRRVDGRNFLLRVAIQRAKREMPEFQRQLASPRPGQRFAIRARYPTSTEPEFLWLRNPRLTDGGFEGILDESPIAIPKLKRGQAVRVKHEDVVDWLIAERTGRRQGGYTERALQERTP